MSKISAISLRSQWLGEKLRDARLRSGYLMREAADHVQTDQATLSRFERGTHKIKRALVRELIDFYGVADERERDYFLQLADDAWRKDWWNADTSGIESWFIDYAWIESRATKIHTFEPLVISGLLQTPRYAAATIVTGFDPGVSASSIERAVDVRMARQEALHAKQPTQLSVIVERPALERPVGGNDVLREQLHHLIDCAGRDNIDIRVLAPQASWDPGHHGPFSYFQMPDPYPEIGFIENLAGRTFLEEASRVERFRQAYDDISQLALDSTESIQYIKDTLRDIP